MPVFCSLAGRYEAFIDLINVQLRPSVLDDGFEIPPISNYAYNPSNTPWTFTGTSGISSNQTDFTRGNPDTDWFIVAAAEHVSSLGRGVVERNLDRMHPGARWFLEEGLRVTLDGYLAARRRRFGYVRELDELLGDDGIVLSPTIASPGWLAEGRMTADDQVGPLPGEVFNTSVQNTTGHPALSLPAGRLPNGLPFGLQVTGPRFRDELLLALANSWEEARPWPHVADGYETFDAGIAA